LSLRAGQRQRQREGGEKQTSCFHGRSWFLVSFLARLYRLTGYLITCNRQNFFDSWPAGRFVISTPPVPGKRAPTLTL
jgi:hypothetical protein